MKRKLLALSLVLELAVAGYLLFWPVPVEPVSWSAPLSPGYAGPHEANERLTALQKIPLGDDHGPEHVAVGPDGKLYVAVASGNILRMNPDGGGREVFANSGGRVLGFDFDAAGRLIAADAYRGLLAIGADRQPVVLADKVGGDPIRYADGVVVASDGVIYFTDASTRFGAKQWGGTFEASVLDILEQAASGRVLAYDPGTKTTRIVAKGMAFPNGIALSQDGRQLFVAETGKYRVWKLPVTASSLDVAASGAKPLLDNLPGYPDNLMRGLDGKLWMGLVKPRNTVIDKLADQPFLRKVTLRLPRALWPVPKAYGHVVAFTEDGKVVADLQDPSGAYPETTAVTETAERLYIQSLHAKDLGWLPRAR